MTTLKLYDAEYTDNSIEVKDSENTVELVFDFDDNSDLLSFFIDKYDLPKLITALQELQNQIYETQKTL